MNSTLGECDPGRTAADRPDRGGRPDDHRARARRAPAPGARRRGRRAVPRRPRARPRLPRPAGADRGAVRRRPVARQGPGRAALPHRRPGAARRGRDARLPRPRRRPGQDPRIPGRAGRDRVGAARPRRRRAGRGAGRATAGSPPTSCRAAGWRGRRRMGGAARTALLPPSATTCSPAGTAPTTAPRSRARRCARGATPRSPGSASSRPRRVLEIGVGSGLLLSELAPAASTTGAPTCPRRPSRPCGGRLDPAWADRVRAATRTLPTSSPGCPAGFDTIVINSVAQYFPSAEYLRDVLRRGARAARARWRRLRR